MASLLDVPISSLKKSRRKNGNNNILSFLTMFINLGIKRPEISILLSGFCIIIAVIILYRNLTLLTSETTMNMKLKILRSTTIFNLTIVIISFLGAMFILLSDDMFLEYQEKIFAILLITSIIIFVGIISPKLPFTRYTGLSLPIACLYVGCSLIIENFKIVTLIAVMLWIGIPAFISYCFYIKKM